MATATPRLSRDQVIVKMATEDGVTDQGEISRRLVTMGYGKIGAERVGQILRASSGRDKIVRFFEEHPDDTFTSMEVSTWTKLDINKVNYVIDGLQKKGVVTFKVGQNTNNHRTLIDVKLTKRARAQIAERVARAVKAAPEVDHRKVEAPAVEALPVEAQEPEVKPDESVEMSAADNADTSQAPGAGPESTPESPAEARVDSSDMGIVDFLKYPLIAKLLDRERDLNEAAKLLDRHGLEDLELAVLGKMDEYTPLEREVLALAQAYIKACK